MHITLTGNLGSGKSTVSRIMNAQYGYEIYSTGKIMRHLAEERGITVLAMNQLAQSDPSYDNIIDDTTRRISLEKKDDILFDSRLAWHFAVGAFKVFLSVSIDEAARRVFNDNRGDVESYTSVEHAKEQLLARAHTEDIRYKDIYGIDYFKTSNYNLMLDSTFNDPDTLAGVIESEKRRFESLSEDERKASGPRILLSPVRLCGERPADGLRRRETYDSDVRVCKKGEDFEVVSGMDKVIEAARLGYDFISVTSDDDIA